MNPSYIVNVPKIEGLSPFPFPPILWSSSSSSPGTNVVPGRSPPTRSCSPPIAAEWLEMAQNLLQGDEDF
ncbi:unnamed protein product [Citrullus colocynthis]|uniref:Uncharacterized protein n=1 Tax=Citrullus colocynthis TaxID=252529 RepID=A0ABP0Y7A4_9ROSI